MTGDYEAQGWDDGAADRLAGLPCKKTELALAEGTEEERAYAQGYLDGYFAEEEA